MLRAPASSSVLQRSQFTFCADGLGPDVILLRAAARFLRMTRETLRYRLKKFGIREEAGKDNE